MKITIKEPTKAYIEGQVSGVLLSSLKEFLTYRNKALQFEVKRMEKGLAFYRGPRLEAQKEKIEELKKQVKVCLLNEDDDGLWFYSGLVETVAKFLKCPVENKVTYPEPNLLPWSKTPEFTPYPYQKESVELLIKNKHAGVELATGLGKSLILLNICRELGLKTVVMTPSTSISEQLYELFVKHLGKKYVGAFWGGKKEVDKLIVIGNGQSLTRIQEGSKEWKAISKSDVFLADESHQTPAATFENVCTGVLKNASYRFFLSATQMRNDGLDLLLEGITGPMVKKMSAKNGMEQGYLATVRFKMIAVESKVQYRSSDANELTRKHLYYCPEVLKVAGQLINASVAQGKPTLVLIDEVEQFTKLAHFLQHEVAFAHGPLGENKSKVPEKYWDSEPNDLVKQFNDLKIPILIGTSCISTGTDIKAVKTMIYLKGGKSRIEVMQSVGRCTRKTDQKQECDVYDFDIVNQEVLHKHALVRESIYNEINGPVKKFSV